jgi:hypothetical protein
VKSLSDLISSVVGIRVVTNLSDCKSFVGGDIIGISVFTNLSDFKSFVGRDLGMSVDTDFKSFVGGDLVPCCGNIGSSLATGGGAIIDQ